MSSYIVNFQNEEEIPFCIICQETIVENASHDLSYNNYCSCNFHYHPMCYEKWINLVKQEQCLICRQDISMNFLNTIPFYTTRTQSIMPIRRRPSFINIAMMSPRTRYRYGIPFMYQPRRISNLDRVFNVLSCNNTEQTNSLVDYVYHNLDCFVAICLTFFCMSCIITVIVVFSMYYLF